MSNTKTVPVEVRVYAVVDAVNETRVVVCQWEGDEVYTEALTHKGEWITFEAEAYYLEVWCRENGLTLYAGTIEDDAYLEEVV